jgi:hypothetical protein
MPMMTCDVQEPHNAQNTNLLFASKQQHLKSACIVLESWIAVMTCLRPHLDGLVTGGRVQAACFVVHHTQNPPFVSRQLMLLQLRRATIQPATILTACRVLMIPYDWQIVEEIENVRNTLIRTDLDVLYWSLRYNIYVIYNTVLYIELFIYCNRW